jgi:hypothetical protein
MVLYLIKLQKKTPQSIHKPQKYMTAHVPDTGTSIKRGCAKLVTSAQTSPLTEMGGHASK